MNPNYLLMSILFSVALVISTLAAGQIKIVNVITPPEIKLVPLPARVVIFHDLDANELQVSRQKKEDLIRECIDTVLSVFKNTITKELPTVEFVLEPTEIDDSVNTPYFLVKRYQADLALGIADFRPQVRQGEVTTTVNDDNSKSKSASYFMASNGVLRIYNKDSLVSTFPFSESRFLQDREVISGLFAVGPSLVKNKAAALELTDRAAKNLALKFIEQESSYTVTLFKKKELKEVTNLIQQNNYDEALQKASQLTSHKNEVISSRAHYLCAFLYHTQMDFSKAFEHAQRAFEIGKIDKQTWTGYYFFLKKYVVDNQVVWKE